MVRIIASVVAVLVLSVCQKVSLCLLDAVLESVAEKVILPVSPPGQVYLRSAALFGWGRTLAADTDRVGPAPLDCQNLLHAEVVLPIIVKVILVQKPLAQTETKISQPDMSRVIGKATAPVIGDAVLLTVDKEPMKMAVRPPQGQLKDMMKLSNGGLRADEETTPDERTDAA
jgi:hypothetical protein